MGPNIFVVALFISMVLHGANCQTIDEIILLAQEDQSDSELFRDNKTVKVELDMLFDAEEYARIYQQDVEAEQSEAQGGRSRKKRKAIRYESKRWTNKVIPYYINNGFSQGDRAQIQAAVNDWNTYTCLTFRPYRNGDRNYINIQGGGGCSSFVGMSGGSQPLTLGRYCRRKGIIIHEMGHALGFHHEQTRPDRDQYVQIYYQNIQRGMAYNFQRHSTSIINDHGVPYDYLSVMHYGKTAFTTNGAVTISTKDRAYQNIIGTRQTLSFKDVKLANLIYKCGSHCGDKKCTGDGFVGKDCKCYCPGNPTKLCGGGGGTGGGDKNCKDNHPNCPSWAAKGDCDDSGVTPPKAWMLVHCKLSCKKCTGGGGGGTTTPKPTPSCTDKKQYCGYWKTQGHCTSSAYTLYMRTNCPLSCNVCNTGGGGRPATPAPTRAPTPRPTPAPSCHDTSGSCRYWASIGECRRNPAYMLQYCKKSCRQC